MNNLPPPKPLDTSSSALAEAWKKWKSRFQIYLEATNLKAESNQRKIAILLHTIGEDAQEIAETFTYQNDRGEHIAKEAATLEMLISKFDEFYIPKRNVTYERRKFLTETQKEDQTIDEYVAELRRLAKTCEYDHFTEEFIKDQMVGGILDEAMREKLLRTTDLNLQKALQICRAAEAAKLQIKTFRKKENNATIAALKEQQTSRIQKNTRRYGGENRQTANWARNCSRCGEKHEPRSCPAYGKTCIKCQKPNHYAKVCRARRIQELETDTETEEETETFLLELQANRKKHTLDAVIQTEGVPIKFRLDTGAQANVIPYETWEQLPTRTPIRRTSKSLVTYTRQPVKLVGECTLRCKKDKKYTKLEFLVTRTNHGAILGLQACCQDLQLLQINTLREHTLNKGKQNLNTQSIIDHYADVFKGLGELRGEYHITLKEGTTPKIHAPRKIPFAIHDKVKEELHKMERQGIIKKVHQPTEWVNPIVVIKKANGSIRICLDPRELNEAMKRSHYKLPTFEEISSRIKNAKYFTIADGSRAFLQKKLDHVSSLLCTFATPFGRYRFLRLPYGIKAAPEVFQRDMTEMLEEHDHAETFVDDVIVWGETLEQHNQNLVKFLEIARRSGLKLEKEKLQLAKQEVKYLGHKLTCEGIQIDEEKKKAVTEMETPKNTAELQRFLGMTNFLMKYLPNLADTVAPLRELLRKDIAWCWYHSHEKAFQGIKKKLTEAPTLAYFDNYKSVEITVDASPEGLGAVLEQNGKAIAYASTTLNPTQKRYAHIEKELLAVTYACEKFHQYTYGRPFIVYTDHKPLIPMSRKPLAELTTRIQRLFMRLQKYDVELKYKPGNEMYVADTLSRAPLKTQNHITAEEDTIVQQLLEIQDNIKLQQVRSATQEDTTLRKLKEYIEKGWPQYHKEVPTEVKQYWKEKNTLQSTKEGLIMRGEQIVIPEKLQQQMLSRLHESHQGVTNTKRRARTTIYWPKMNQQIEEMSSKCNTCKKYQNNNPRQPYIPHHIPNIPWSKIAADFFQWNCKYYIQVIDYYSKYTEVEEIKDLQAKTVIPVLKAIFAKYHPQSDG